MRHIAMLIVTAAAVVVLITTPAYADLGDQLFKLLADDGAEEDIFGDSIAIDNGIVAVGAPGDEDNGYSSGSAYLFDASTGAQIHKLVPSDGHALDKFGRSIDIDNGIVAVGAWGDDGIGPNSGSAYLFDVSTGAQIAKLLPNDGALSDFFGFSIAIDNGIVVVGAWGDDDNGTNSGSAYLFDASTGALLFNLLPNDGATENRFGWSVAIGGTTAIVGALWDNDNGEKSGSAYLFDVATGRQIVKLLPDDGAAEDVFGSSVAIDNGVVAVGAYGDDDNGSKSGSAYLFDASSGAQLFKLLPIDGAVEDYFGISIAIANGVVAVGAYLDNDNGAGSGSAYLFNAFTGAQLFKLLPSDGQWAAFFGWSIAIDDGIVAVGAWWDDDIGSAYLFDAIIPCPWNLDDDNNVGTSDLLTLLSAWGSCFKCEFGAKCAADFDNDCAVGTSDLLILFANWGPCP